MWIDSSCLAISGNLHGCCHNQSVKSQQENVDTNTYHVQTTINVRDGPGREYRVIGQLNKNDSVYIKSVKGECAVISFKTHDIAYVYKPLLHHDHAPIDAEKFRELRYQGIKNIGWVAGNSSNHPIWPQVAPYVGEDGEYYKAFVYIKTPGTTNDEAEAYANVSLYRKWRDLGEQSPFNEQACMDKISRTIQISQELTELMNNQ